MWWWYLHLGLRFNFSISASQSLVPRVPLHHKQRERGEVHNQLFDLFNPPKLYLASPEYWVLANAIFSVRIFYVMNHFINLLILFKPKKSLSTLLLTVNEFLLLLLQSEITFWNIIIPWLLLNAWWQSYFCRVRTALNTHWALRQQVNIN